MSGVLVHSRGAGTIHCMPLLSVAMTTAASIHLSSSQLQGARQLARRDVLSVSFSLFSLGRLKGTTDELKSALDDHSNSNRIINIHLLQARIRPRESWMIHEQLICLVLVLILMLTCVSELR